MLKCLLSEVFNCQTVKDVEVFLQAPCVLFVRGFYGLGIGRFHHVCLSEVLVSKGFFRSCFLVFVGLQFVSESFLGYPCLSEFGCQSIALDSFVRCVRGFKI